MPDTQPTAAAGSPPQRRIRSYVLRAGRITAAQQRALQELWPRYGIDGPAPGVTAYLDPQQLFGRVAPLAVEIGFGNGDNLLALARREPERNFLGLEVHRAGVGHLMHQAAEADLHNLRIACHDAVEVFSQQLAPGSVDEVLILFPDPWHKTRHHKRRLIQPEFVDLLASRLRLGGHLSLATDWEPYAIHMLEVIGANAALRNRAPTGSGYVPRPDWRALTRFERRGQRLGHGVYDLSFERVATPG
ncbi:MAG: tRNA (guanosine(46)-N7)-methyltransferase TrmB [Steroidobacteraceae bacterium]